MKDGGLLLSVENLTDSLKHDMLSRMKLSSF